MSQKNTARLWSAFPNRRMPCSGRFCSKTQKKSRVYISDVRKTGYVPIETEYFVTDKHDGFCGVEIILHTGRTHQIRAHMAHIGHPVVGDGKYSSAAVNRRFGRDT